MPPRRPPLPKSPPRIPLKVPTKLPTRLSTLSRSPAAPLFPVRIPCTAPIMLAIIASKLLIMLSSTFSTWLKMPAWIFLCENLHNILSYISNTSNKSSFQCCQKSLKRCLQVGDDGIDQVLDVTCNHLSLAIGAI